MIFTQIFATIVATFYVSQAGARVADGFIQSFNTGKFVTALIGIAWLAFIALTGLASWELSGVLLWHLAPNATWGVGS